MSPDSGPLHHGLALFLRGRVALQNYLASFPIEPSGAGIERAELAAWKNAAEEYDETTWLRAR